MRTRGIRLAGILGIVAALAPPLASAQEVRDDRPGGTPPDTYRPLLYRAQADATGYAPPDVELPIPTGSFLPSGFFTFGGFVLYRQSNPLRNQLVAVRGFVDTDGSVSGTPGTFEGSRAIALQTNQVRGPGGYQPGFNVGVGYRFDDGSALSLGWTHLTSAHYTALATLVPPQHLLDGSLANTFLFSPVTNFPNDFSGIPFKVAGIGGGPFGIWNGATLMTEEFIQRTEFVDITYRKPIFETENWRTYGLAGPRFVWFWERYKWFTSDLDFIGDSAPAFSANYTNIVSNRMYGGKVGFGNECYLGHGLSVSLDLTGQLLLDVVKERVDYARGDKHIGPERKRSRTDYTAVPAAQGTFNVWWYPYRGIQLKFGYDAQIFFNTVASQHPIDFDFSAVNPGFNRVIRILDGLDLGIAFTF